MKALVETKRILLRAFQDSDAEAAKRFWGDEEVMRYCLGATLHDKLPMTLKCYRDCHEAKGISVYAVVEKETGDVIGACGFNVTGELQEVELIYHFAKSSWGKGYATEAAKACLELARENGSVKRIHASVDPNNMDSHKILKKIGFVYAGTEWFEDTAQEESVYELRLS
ncbi:GNAT family N-acetyltransferase [Paenibacillus sp. KQZ6P-2]|uniref:GNAT family N-acetyltransferase n=1 Tax=Paenibacillus mangrovi TaxID=2931978 RepID=A0A9X1WNR6_9BACL|nr:GNAT family N-acetyltransferase [Paenibacillus mangrovi]MCJ8011976.1 GNAT family N-acetyltransferase [Paenibacillus mangrovi]